MAAETAQRPFVSRLSWQRAGEFPSRHHGGRSQRRSGPTFAAMADPPEQNAEGSRETPSLLSDAEFGVYVALVDLIDELEYAPTHAQLLGRTGRKSRGSLNAVLKSLAAKGVI